MIAITPLQIKYVTEVKLSDTIDVTAIGYPEDFKGVSNITS